MADRSTSDITVNEWLAELERLQRRSDEGATTDELAEAWGCHRMTALVRLRQLVRQGRVVCGFRQSERIDGRPYRVPVYRIKPRGRGSRT